MLQNNIITHPCDGLVLAENAMDFPGLTFPPQKIPGQLDHQQMRNAAGTKPILNNLFNGDYDNGSGFFYTKKVE